MSVLTLICRGVAQVFHVLLVELRLQLVVEVEEEGKEDGQEEGEEVESGEDQREERTLSWMAMKMGVKGARLNLSHDVSVMKNVQGSGLRARAQLCSATQSVKCAVALSSPSSLASVSLSFLS